MFQLVFKGECTSGTDVQTARANAKALFKASVEQLDRMFSGQAVVRQETQLTCLSKSRGLTMALLVIVRVSLGHFDTFIRLLDIFLGGLLGF